MHVYKVMTYRVPSLDEDSTRTSKLAHQTFTCCKTRDDATRGDTLHYVLAVPCNEVAVVGNVLLALDQLAKVSF